MCFFSGVALPRAHGLFSTATQNSAGTVTRSAAVRGVPEVEFRIGRGFRALRSPDEVTGYTPRSAKKERNCAGSAQLSKNQEKSELSEAELKKLPQTLNPL